MSVPALPGRLRPERMVGSGAYATVWLARDPDLDCDVAVKILAENWAYRADVRERFLSEARLMRRVDHEGIVRVYDVGALPDGRPFLVMTYAAGGSLHDRLSSGPLAPELARDVLHQVGAALVELHRHGIVHRDVNPRNILFSGDPDAPRVMLADLGLAKDLAAESGLTQPMGTGDYRAPEQQAYSDRIGPATDVYAFATVAADVLPESVRAAAPVADVLRRAAAAEPGDRPGVADILAVVDAAYARLRPGAHEARGGGHRSGRRYGGATNPLLAPATTPVPPRTAAPRPTGASAGGAARRRPGGRAALLVLAVLLVVGAGAWFAWRQWLGPVRVQDHTGSVSVVVPRDWVAEGSARMPGVEATGSGVVVRSADRAQRVEVTWAEGAHEADAQFTREHRPGCRAAAPVPVTVAGLAGQRTSWTDCGDGRSYVVAVARDGARRTVEVRIDQRGGRPDVDDVLAGVRVSPVS